MQKIQYKLLYYISENARLSLTESGKLMRQSPQRLKYGIEKLKSDGILGEAYTVFDYSYLGLLLFRVYFKGAYIRETDKQRVISKLQDVPYVTSIYEMMGEYDLVVEFLCPNPSKFNKEIKNAITLLPKPSDHKIILNLVTYICPRNYLVSRGKYFEKIIGGDREIIEFSENEKKVMKCLLEEPTANISNISKTSGLAARTVKNIINELTDRKMMRGFKHIVNPNQLGVTRSRLFLKLHNITPEREQDLVNLLLKRNNIIQINKTIGDWDMEIDLESYEKGQTRFIIMKIKDEFQDLIESFNLIQFDQYFKRSYLPKFVFD